MEELQGFFEEADATNRKNHSLQRVYAATLTALCSAWGLRPTAKQSFCSPI